MDARRLHQNIAEIMEAAAACGASTAAAGNFSARRPPCSGTAPELRRNTPTKGKCSAARPGSRCGNSPAASIRRRIAPRPGRETRRFLSAVTLRGWWCSTKPCRLFAPRIYSIEDEHGAASRLLLAELRRRALEAGLDIISCACPLSRRKSWSICSFPPSGWDSPPPILGTRRISRFTDGFTLPASPTRRGCAPAASCSPLIAVRPENCSARRSPSLRKPKPLMTLWKHSISPLWIGKGQPF